MTARRALITGLVALSVAAALQAQRSRGQQGSGSAGIPDKNPYTSAADIELGRKLYAGRCGHCHGQAGEGGRGAVINTGIFRHASSDRDLFLIIRNGIPDTEMPGAFSLPEAEIWKMVAWIRQFGHEGKAETAKGDPAAGSRVYQKAGCAGCHTIAGAGGLYGPDLTGIGSRRAVRHLRESVVNPGADIPLDYRSVAVVTRDGKRISGIHLNEDEYTVHLRDPGGNLLSLRKADLTELRLPRESQMPAYTSFSAAELDNLVAWLNSLRADTLR